MSSFDSSQVRDSQPCPSVLDAIIIHEHIDTPCSGSDSAKHIAMLETLVAQKICRSGAAAIERPISSRRSPTKVGRTQPVQAGACEAAPQAGSPPEQEWEYPSREQSRRIRRRKQVGVQVAPGKVVAGILKAVRRDQLVALLSRTIQSARRIHSQRQYIFRRQRRIASVVVTTGRIQPGDTAMYPIQRAPPG